MSNDITVYDDRSAALELRRNQVAFTAQQVAVLRSIGLEKASPNELGALLHASQRFDLDPFAKQITMIPSWDKQAGAERYSIHITIDGYLALAERTGRFIGIEGPYWCGQDGQWTDVWLSDEPPAAARVTVHYYDTRGRERTANGTVTYKDRVRRKKDGTPMALWATMPDEMLANAALRQAIRRGLPEALDVVEREVDAANLELDNAEVVPQHRPRMLHARRQVEPEDPFDFSDMPAERKPAEAYRVAVSGAEELPHEPAGRATRAQIGTIKQLVRQLGLTDEQYRGVLLKDYGVDSSVDLETGQAAAVIRRLRAKVESAQQAGDTQDDNEPVDAELVDGDDTAEDNPFAIGDGDDAEEVA